MLEKVINYFRNRKKVASVNKLISLWYLASMANIKGEDLFEPRPKVGTVCFFIGSIDGLCQSLKLDDSSFFGITLKFFSNKQFFKFDQIAPVIIDNYFLKNQRIKFATDAMKVGMDTLQHWYNTSFLSEDDIKKLSELIKGWNRKPNLEGDELYLLIPKEKE